MQGSVRAPAAAPPTPPITAPAPALPEREPIAAPAPAPKSPPDTARSPGVVPQADNASAAASTADTERVLSFIDMFPSPFWVRFKNGSHIESFPFPQGMGR